MASYKSRAKKKIKRKIRKSPIVIAIVITLAILGALLLFFGDKLGLDFWKKKIKAEVPMPSDGEVMFHYIDVGQGDAILIMSKAGNILIDSGDIDSDSQKAFRNYLEAANVQSFEYVIFTHPDADHIGSADYVIENYLVKNVIMPSCQATTNVYERLMSAIDAKDVNLILIGENGEPSGYSFYLGSMLNTVIAPTKSFDDANQMSIVLKSTYGETSFMFTGDAEDKSEKEILSTWSAGDLKCDVLKVGHHGSSSSTTKAFLSAVSPKIAVISCGEGNDYGHPSREVLERLEAAGVTVYRTDVLGTIVLKSDGKTVSLAKTDK